MNKNISSIAHTQTRIFPKFVEFHAVLKKEIIRSRYIEWSLLSYQWSYIGAKLLLTVKRRKKYIEAMKSALTADMIINNYVDTIYEWDNYYFDRVHLLY